MFAIKVSGRLCVYNIIYVYLLRYLCILLLSPCIMGNILFNRLNYNLFETRKRRTIDVNTVYQRATSSIISYNNNIMGPILYDHDDDVEAHWISYMVGSFHLFWDYFIVLYSLCVQSLTI